MATNVNISVASGDTQKSVQVVLVSVKGSTGEPDVYVVAPGESKEIVVGDKQYIHVVEKQDG